MRARVAAFSLALTALFFALPAAAQFDPTLYSSSISIGFSPAHPAPGDTVTLSAVGSGIDLSRSEVAWYVDDKEVAHGFGIASTQVQAGALGSRKAIELDIVPPSGSFLTAKATLAPTEVDLLISSDSYVPPFYRGRALPTVGTRIIAEAIPRFALPGGALVPDSQLVFTWRYNGDVLKNASGLGKSSASIPIAHLFGGNDIAVEARTQDGTLSGAAEVSLASREPLLDLYEDHPLYGLLFNNALSSGARIAESEMTFAALPYFALASGPADAHLTYSWRVNGSQVRASATSSNELTINADNSSGQAYLELDLSQNNNIYTSISGAWSLTLSSSEAPGSPFTH